MERESFKSRLGFILVSAGCAIGIGNVWRFPFVTGQNGGGIFVLFYLVFLLIMGVPVLTMELAVGRAARNSAYRAFKSLEPKGTYWHIHGIACIIGNYILMMYYTTVAGWMLAYFFKFITGQFETVSKSDILNVFPSLQANPGQMTLWMGVIVVGGFLVLSVGIQKGLEKITKWMMSLLLVLIVILAVHSITLPNASGGLSFYLLPSLERAKETGIINVIVAAMNQAFFTLSLGIASMQIFGSYMSKNDSLLGEALRISILDTFVAIVSGLIIFPACFAFGTNPDAGPGLIFITLPNVFADMSGGRFWGSLFFLFMTFASFSTVIAVFENIMAACMDNFGWGRKKVAIINGVIIFIGSLPCVWGYNILSNLRLIGGRDVLDSEDFIVSNLLLPIGSLVFLVFCVTKLGWGYSEYKKEANTGKGLKIPDSKLLEYYLKFILPILIIIILASGLI